MIGKATMDANRLKEPMTDEEKRRAERQRVDAHYAKAQAARGKSLSQKSSGKTYPMAIEMLGQGFRNLYDSLGGQDR